VPVAVYRSEQNQQPAVVRYAVLREPRQGAAALCEKQTIAGSFVAAELGKRGVER